MVGGGQVPPCPYGSYGPATYPPIPTPILLKCLETRADAWAREREPALARVRREARDRSQSAQHARQLCAVRRWSWRIGLLCLRRSLRPLKLRLLCQLLFCLTLRYSCSTSSHSQQLGASPFPVAHVQLPQQPLARDPAATTAAQRASLTSQPPLLFHTLPSPQPVPFTSYQLG